MTMDCTVYRCKKQEEMYLYLRAGMTPDELPVALLRQVGALTEVMTLALSEDSKLARADAARVIDKLATDGFYLQMPPSALVNPKLYFGD